MVWVDVLRLFNGYRRCVVIMVYYVLDYIRFFVSALNKFERLIAEEINWVNGGIRVVGIIVNRFWIEWGY